MNEHGTYISPKLEGWTFPEDTKWVSPLKELNEIVVSFYEEVSAETLDSDNLEIYLQKILLVFRQNKPWGMYRAFLSSMDDVQSLAKKTTGFLVAAYLFAQHMDWSGEEQVMLLQSGLIHDTGMCLVPPEILDKNGRLEAHERAEIERHPEYSRQLAMELKVKGVVTRAVFEHHERYDGKGYPQGLSDAEISSYAQILAVLDYLVALITERDYRDSLVGYSALKKILETEGSLVSSAIIRSLSLCFGFFPPGSLVLLSDGSIGRVLEPSKQNPVRPLLRIVVDPEGNIFQDDNNSPHLDMDKKEDVYIVRPLSAQDLES